MKITITNWDKYNPKRSQKTYSWLRLNNDIFFSQDLFGLSSNEKLLWIFLLCVASRKNSGEMEIDSKYVAFSIGIKESEVTHGVDKLVDKLLVTRTTPALPRTTPVLHHTTPTNERTRRDETNDTDGRDGHSDSKVGVVKPLNLVDDLAQVWNEKCGKMTKIRTPKKLSDSRKSKIRSRMKSHQDMRYWTQVIERMATSDFCNGMNSTGWIADFDFLLKPDTHEKVLEGKYDNRKRVTPADQATENLSNLWEEVQDGK